MIWKLKLRKKREGEKKKKRGFEDSMKAKAKLNLYEKRYEIIERLEMTTQDEEKGNVNVGAGNIAKVALIATQALGEIGDRYRISKKAAKGWKKLLGDYFDSQIHNGLSHPMTTELEGLVFEAFVNLMNRSVRREHTDVEFVLLPPEMFMSNYMQRAERTSTLEK